MTDTAAGTFTLDLRASQKGYRRAPLAMTLTLCCCLSCCCSS